MKHILYLATAIILITSCKQEKSNNKAQNDLKSIHETTLKSADSSANNKLGNEYMVLGTLYQQKAGEYRALCYQAFNLGKLMLDADLKDASVDKHRIVILDVDETVLDNSPFQAKCIKDGTNYPVNWDEWCKKSSAMPLPGVLDFLSYAKSNGVSIYYVTNRKSHLKEATINNLVVMGFPQADAEHVITRTTDDSKEGRRQELASKYHISLLFGDNLNDFSNVFEKKDSYTRAASVDEYKNEFGRRFIVLPNAMYGDWELALYNYDSKLSDSTKSALRHEALMGF